MRQTFLKARGSFERAFTLVEVIVSLLILSIAILGIFQGQAGSTKIVRRSEAMAQALNLAEEKMTEIELQLRQKTFVSLPEEEKGEFKDEAFKGFKWKRELEKVSFGCIFPESLLNPVGEGGQTAENPISSLVEKVFENAVRKIRVTVEWQEGDKTKSTELVQLYVRFQDLPR